MSEENKTPAKEKMEEKVETPKKEAKAEVAGAEMKKEVKKVVEQAKEKGAAAAKKDDKKLEDKAEKKDAKKKDEKPKVKKEEAVARGSSLHMSKKHAMALSRFVKFKDIDTALSHLDKVMKMKMAVPMKGEIPHRKGNMMSGRYPIKAAGQFVNVLKALKGNALVNGLELEKAKIYFASASWAARPMRRGGRQQSKRTNLTIKCKEFTDVNTKVNLKKNKDSNLTKEFTGKDNVKNVEEKK